MASATSATLVMKPNACTNDPKRKALCNLPCTSSQPGSSGRRARTSASDRFCHSAGHECPDFRDGRQPPTTRALAHITVRFIASHEVFNKPKTHVIAVVPYANGGQTSRVDRVQEIFNQGTCTVRNSESHRTVC